MKPIDLKPNIEIDLTRRVKSFYSGGNEYGVYLSKNNLHLILVEWEQVDYDDWIYYSLAVADTWKGIDDSIMTIYEENADYDMNL